MKMHKVLAITIGLGVLTALGAPVEAKHKVFRYRHKHPIPVAVGGGFCAVDGPHDHPFGPHEHRLYRVHRGEYYFVGDPVAFGYTGPRFAFYGAHPVVEIGLDFGEPVYCYLDGPHYHWYEPPRAAHFEVHAGVHWYVGDFAPVYYSARPRYVAINRVYRPMRYARPVVDIRAAPPAFHARHGGRPTVVGRPVGSTQPGMVGRPVGPAQSPMVGRPIVPAPAVRGRPAPVAVPGAMMVQQPVRAHDRGRHGGGEGHRGGGGHHGGGRGKHGKHK